MTAKETKRGRRKLTMSLQPPQAQNTKITSSSFLTWDDRHLYSDYIFDYSRKSQSPEKELILVDSDAEKNSGDSDSNESIKDLTESSHENQEGVMS